MQDKLYTDMILPEGSIEIRAKGVNLVTAFYFRSSSPEQEYHEENIK
jgi:hypothetical protein